MPFFLISLFGKDRLGIVAEVSKVLYQLNLNIEDSSRGCSKNLFSGPSPQPQRELTLSSPCPTLPCGRRGIFPPKNREKEGYLQNLLDNGKDFKIHPVFRVPSIGPTTGIQQALKAFHS